MTMPEKNTVYESHNKALMTNSDERANLSYLLKVLCFLIKEKPINRIKVTEVLHCILLQTTKHFNHEDAMLFDAGYAGYLDHQGKNQHLLDLVISLVHQHRDGKIDIESKSKELLELWEFLHQNERERVLIDFLTETSPAQKTNPIN
jgi:hemerythrin